MSRTEPRRFKRPRAAWRDLGINSPRHLRFVRWDHSDWELCWCRPVGLLLFASVLLTALASKRVNAV